MSAGSYQRAASSNNSSTNGNGCDTAPTVSGSVRLAGDNTKDRMYEPKHNQKAVRVLTVIAYVFFVSLAAITLSLYYLFVYDPPPQPADRVYGAATDVNGKHYPSPILINITDCKQVVAVAVMNRTRPIQTMETPRVLSVRDPPPTTPSPPPRVDTFENRTASGGRRRNSTKYAYGDYAKGIDNEMDYYE